MANEIDLKYTMDDKIREIIAARVVLQYTGFCADTMMDNVAIIQADNTDVGVDMRHDYRTSLIRSKVLV